MAIEVGDYIELVVRLDVVEKYYPGGIEGLKKDYPHMSSVPYKEGWFPSMDEHLAYITGAMSGFDMDQKLAEFEAKLGKKIARYRNGKPVEFVNGFITEMCRITLPCKFARPVDHMGGFEWIPPEERK